MCLTYLLYVSGQKHDCLIHRCLHTVRFTNERVITFASLLGF